MTPLTMQLMLVALMYIAFGGFLHTAWQGGPMNRTRILQTMAFAAMALIDAGFLIHLHRHAS